MTIIMMIYFGSFGHLRCRWAEVLDGKFLQNFPIVNCHAYDLLAAWAVYAAIIFSEIWNFPLSYEIESGCWVVRRVQLLAKWFKNRSSQRDWIDGMKTGNSELKFCELNCLQRSCVIECANNFTIGKITFRRFISNSLP